MRRNALCTTTSVVLTTHPARMREKNKLKNNKKTTRTNTAETLVRGKSKKGLRVSCT